MAKVMNSETLEEVLTSFNEIDVDDELCSNYCERRPIQRRSLKPFVYFEKYINEKCCNQIQILNRETFHKIKKPIIILFNHFRRLCAYHIRQLDILHILALEYGYHIEFIAADMLDIDIIYPRRNPLKFFDSLTPEFALPKIFAIDEQKRIFEHSEWVFVRKLMRLCENLLMGRLLKSQPIHQPNATSLVKRCVYQNYEELVLKSTKNILLIIDLKDYYQYFPVEPCFENVALAFKDYNLDIVYMEAVKNYIPFEYDVKYYPTILFIPFNDKKNFIYYEHQTNEKLLIEFLKYIMEQPENLQYEQQKLKSAVLQKHVQVPDNFQMALYRLPTIFKRFDNKFQFLDKKENILENLSVKKMFIVAFMDFSKKKCTALHIKWMNQLYQFAESSCSCQIILADFNDIGIINNEWKVADVRSSAQGKPQIYVIDCFKHSHEFGDFVSSENLYYFICAVKYRQVHYSQPYDKKYNDGKIKIWTSNYFHYLIKNCKKDILITFYSSTDVNAENVANFLERLADYTANLDIELVKYDVEFNYVGLKYAQDRYPAIYFISKRNKKKPIKFFSINNDFNIK